MGCECGYVTEYHEGHTGTTTVYTLYVGKHRK